MGEISQSGQRYVLLKPADNVVEKHSHMTKILH